MPSRPGGGYGLDLPRVGTAILMVNGTGDHSMNTKREVDELPAVEASCKPAGQPAAMRLIVQLCLPDKWEVKLPGIGDVLIRPRLLDPESGKVAGRGGSSAAEMVALECADQMGLLLLDRRLAAGLVNGVLGSGMPPFAGPLSRIERGVVEGVLATLLARFGLAPGIRLRERVIDKVPAAALVIACSVELRGEATWAWFAASAEFFGHAYAHRAPGRPTIVPWLELAATSVPGSEMAGARPGDRIVFDETAAFVPEGDWPARVGWADKSVLARWLADGVVVAEDGWPGVTRGDLATRPERRSDPDSTSASASGGVSVNVCAGIVCGAMDPSVCRPLVVARGAPVLLRAGRRAWAYGDLAELDGAFAVTITRMLAE